ncbi:hypothetical protein CASFOL_003028 [Castilleja foliolosa]|uniref:Uncharacterized protein n=1 Tax=Castilleja foliolosa TaxID=1961234 RepID=A0ABD3EHX1_9LAMI
MDAYEATKTVMSRIQTLDPDNVSKIMGYILIQDQGEKEMIRLAFSPDALLLSYINQAKARLGLPSNSPSPNPHNPPRIMIPDSNGGFRMTLPRPSPRPIPYSAAVLENSDFGDEYQQFPFLDNPGVDPIMSPGGRSDSLVFPYGEDASGGVLSPQAHYHPFHKRSCSANDAALLSSPEEGGCMWRPCMYYARGFCKNGGDCKFVHGDGGCDDPIDAGSPSKNVSGFDEFLRIKALQQQQQRFDFMAARGRHPFAYNRCMDSLNENLRFKSNRNDISLFGLNSCSNSVARQIYLTFPADSTFNEEDVSKHFSTFGPVQDVRIPYQQKRMFGFVSFVYPETVKLILAKGNPHFVCDSRVLVKPYKEKGKFKEKKQHSPSGVDSGEHIGTPFGPRMMLSPRETMLRRKLEQEAEMQLAIELQGQRMMNLKLMDLKNEKHNFHYLPNFPYSSPRHSQFLLNQHLNNSFDSINQEKSEEIEGGQELADEKKVLEGTEFFGDNNINGGDQLQRGNSDYSDLHDSFEHVLPDNLFASPTKSAAENHSGFSQSLSEANEGVQSSNDPMLSGSSPLTIASLRSCYLQPPRFSSGQEAIEM